MLFQNTNLCLQPGLPSQHCRVGRSIDRFNSDSLTDKDKKVDTKYYDVIFMKFKVLFISKQMRKQRRLVQNWWSVSPSPISWSPSMPRQTSQSTVLRCKPIILHKHIAKSQIKLSETQSQKQVWKLDQLEVSTYKHNHK